MTRLSDVERQRRYRENNRDKYNTYMREKHRKYRFQLREEIIIQLGGCCIICGYNTDTRALEIDHVDGGGAAERKGKNGLQIYRAYLARDCVGLQLLCANCHRIKTFQTIWP